MGKVLIGNFKGPQGDQGIQGEEGKAASIMIDSVQTLQPEENATVENVGTTSDARLKFGIPRGADGMTDLVARYEDASEYTATPTSDAPIVINDLNGKTQQGENPSPDNPQMIHGVGDMGYFDGILQKGYYNASGVYTSADNYICTVNKIECKQSDGINVEIETSATSIIVSFFQSSGTFISQQTGSGTSLTATAPANAGYCMISINRASIEPQTSGHISVTINGKYASRVESRTAQLFDASKLPSKTQGGATVTNNGDGSFTISGIGSLSESYDNLSKISSSEALKILKPGNLYLTGMYKNMIPKYYFGLTLNNTFIENKYVTSAAFECEITEEDLKNIESGKYVLKQGIYNAKGGNITPCTIKPMVYQDGDGTWQQYRHTSIQFPLTSPLYDGDKVCYVKPGESYIDENGDTVVADKMLYGHYHENGREVFDGSEDGWKIKQYNNLAAYISVIGLKDSSFCCNFFKTFSIISDKSDGTIGVAIEGINENTNGLFFGIKGIASTLQEWKNWILTHNIEVVYKLAQPWFEPFEDQTPFYNLRSFDNLTYIYSDDPLNPTLTVDVAKNQTGGYIFESLAQAMKNAQKAEAMKSFESRLQALESQAVENI